MAVRSLRHILTIQPAISLLLSIVCVVLFSALWVFPQIKNDVESRQQELARVVASQIERYLEVSAALVRGSAAIPRDANMSARNFQYLLDAQLSATTTMTSIIAVDYQGRILAAGAAKGQESHRHDLLNLDISHNQIFRQVSENRQPHWSETFLSVVTGRLSAAYAVPGEDFIAVGEVDLGQISNFMKDIVASGDLMILIVDQKGQVVADHKGRYTGSQLNVLDIPLVSSVVKSNIPATGRFIFQEQDMIGSMLQIPSMDWHVLVAQPVRSLYRSVSITACIAIAGLIIALLSGVLLSSAMARRLTAVFERLNQRAQDIAGGQLGESWPQTSITEFNQLSENLRQMSETLQRNRTMVSTVLDSIPQSVFWKDVDSVYLGCNRKFAQDAGLAMPDAIIGMNDFDLPWLPEDAQAYRTDDKKVIANNVSHMHIIEPLQKADGTRIWLDTSKIPLTDEAGNVYGVLGVYEDVSERKRTEEELKQYRQHLEDLVISRTAELSDARDAAEAATRAKSEFLANMSHEIRTPMNAVTGMIYLALQTEMTPRQKEFLHKAQFAADSLLGIINDILDFSKIEAGKLEMEQGEFLLDEVLDKVTTIIGMKANEKGLEFVLRVSPDVPLALLGDPLRLSQVLINLCNNAVKFTDRGELVIDISLQRILSEDRVMLRFSVQDTGVGIPAEQISRLFTPFFQADASSTRRFGGTGLGLVICRQLVELMGGEIGVNSEPGKGSEFFFMACFGIGEISSINDFELCADLRGMSVLVVDDSQICRTILAVQLERFGFRVKEASSGDQALHLISTADKPFELVLMDWQMPGIDGIEATHRIRTESCIVVQPKIILITAYENEETQDLIRLHKLDGYLAKPINMSSLLDAIMSAFGKIDAGRTSRFKQYQLPNTAELKTRLGNARLLLVEDNDFNQQVAFELLRNIGITVIVAENGREALELLAHYQFDGVLMDIQMPVMDGLEATRIIRSESGFDKLPIIAMTAHAMASDRQRCMDTGMNDYVTKPINPKELYAVLDRWIHTEAVSVTTAVETEIADDSLCVPVSLPCIDREAGLRCMNNNSQFYREMLLRFMNSKGDTGLQIREKLVQGDRNSAARMAHSMKSTAGSIGAEALMKSAAELERVLDLPDGLFAPQLGNFEQQLSEVIAGLTNAFGQEAVTTAQEQAEGKSLDRQAVGALIDEIISLLEKDMVQALKLLKSLQTLLQGTILESRYKQLAQQMDQFDSDRARDTLEYIKRLL